MSLNSFHPCLRAQLQFEKQLFIKGEVQGSNCVFQIFLGTNFPFLMQLQWNQLVSFVVGINFLRFSYRGRKLLRTLKFVYFNRKH